MLYYDARSKNIKLPISLFLRCHLLRAPSLHPLASISQMSDCCSCLIYVNNVPPVIQYLISFAQVNTMPSTMRGSSKKIGLFLWHLHFVNLLWALVFLKTFPLTENSCPRLLFGRFFCKLNFLTVTSIIPLLIVHKSNSLIITFFYVFKSFFFWSMQRSSLILLFVPPYYAFTIK